MQLVYSKITLILALSLLFLPLQNKDNVQMMALVTTFCDAYKALNIAPLRIKYQSNLRAIKDLDSIEIQSRFFNTTKLDLEGVDRNKLSDELKIEYDVMQYEIALNLKRLSLEKATNFSSLDSVSTIGLFHLPLGKKWYEYFLQKWISAEVTPKEMFVFGLDEIEKVKSKIKEIQVASKMDSLSFYTSLKEDVFFYTDTSEIENAIKKSQNTVEGIYENFFPFTEYVGPLKVKSSTNERMKLAPAYYSNSTFYYSFFGEPFNKRLIDIFFLHEGLPGHHYQRQLVKKLSTSKVAKLNFYAGFIEGWAAYVEEIGDILGVYKTDYDFLGKWEWDIVRSVRVCLDVGINFYGWSDKKAKKFWKSHIPNQDNIMEREITRMKLQPAQVITYKYGADKILKWRDKKMQKSNFNYLDFHREVLHLGELPFAVLNKQFE